MLVCWLVGSTTGGLCVDAGDGRPPELWETHQWGRSDEHATAVPWSAMLSADQEPPTFDEEVTVKDGSPSIRMVAADRQYAFGKPIPLGNDIAGKLIRFYVWVRGENVASEVSTWGGPRFKITFRDADGKSFMTQQRIIWTVGTFPWHCYHGEFRIPRDAAEIRLALVSEGVLDGTLWYSQFSYEFIDKLTGTFDGNEVQDPVTGSVALNTRYDFLSWHVTMLKDRRATRHRFNFMKGGLPGQPLDVTTKAGLRKYFHDVALYRSDGMHRGVAGLAWFYERYNDTGLVPELEDGWIEELYRLVGEVQDPETGYWYYLKRDEATGEYVKHLSLGLTFHIAGSVYAWRDRDVPGPQRIAATTIAQQSSFVDGDGARKPAAWGGQAYDFTTDPDSDPVKCRLVTTWDAVTLLRFCEPALSRAERARAWRATKHAVRYAIDHNMLPTGIFRQQDTDAQLTSDNYVFGIFSDSRWLQRRTDEALPVPAVTARRLGGEVELTFRGDGEDIVSCRLYALAEGEPLEGLDYDDIVAISQMDGESIYTADPLLMMQRIMEAYAQKWDSSLGEVMRGSRAKPTGERLALLGDDVVIGEGGAPVRVRRDGAPRLYATAVSRYNEESTPVLVRLPD